MLELRGPAGADVLGPVGCSRFTLYTLHKATGGSRGRKRGQRRGTQRSTSTTTGAFFGPDELKPPDLSPMEHTAFGSVTET